MRKPRLLVGVALAALILGLAGPSAALGVVPPLGSCTFAATDSSYYNGMTPAAGLYATGPITFSWNMATGAVTEGLWEEISPPVTGTTYHNVIATGTVAGAQVNLTTAIRSDLYPPFAIQGTLVNGVFTGTADGPYLLEATGSVTCNFGSVHAWVGLKNSDDQGTRFDLRAELLDQLGNVVATGTERCVNGVTRNPSLAKEVIVDWETFPVIPAGSAEDFDLRLSTRIGTNLDDTKCVPGPGSSHNNAVGLRVYYDSTARLSRFDTTIGSGVSTNQYLHSNGNACANAPSVGATNLYFDVFAPTASTVAAAKCKDSLAVNFAGGNLWKVIGIWNGDTAPPQDN